MSEKEHDELLDEFSSTAIAGNDILSSCLYVCGIAVLYAGVFAPLVFVLIAVVLFFYKHVYTEVVEALPLNGGAYNCLLNATSKNIAAVAGVMTTLSYVATCVISAKTAAEYVSTIITVPVIPITAAIIGFFTLLTIIGVRDSAKVAKAIFVFHIFTLTLFVCIGVLMIINTGVGHIGENFILTSQSFSVNGAIKLFFLAFAASLLGVSGFESSANFVEQQRQGVFRKTLRNMLTGVLIFNPLITIVILYALPIPAIAQAKDFVLSQAAFTIGGKGLQYLVVADAALVLSGAVLAGFVGATGLLYRMTLDHCLPSSLLLPRLRARNQNMNRIIIGFALLCLSILLMTGGSLLSLAGVYTISFLGVMSLFAIGNMVLRYTRPDLKRTYHAPIIYALLAVAATTAGIVGNILIDPHNLIYFLVYFIPAVFLVISMVYRDYILESVLLAVRRFRPLYDLIDPLFEHVIRPRIILFAHHPHKLYRSLEYIRKNETSRNITVVFCKGEDENTQLLIRKFLQYLETFKEAGIFPNLNIQFEIEEKMTFGPELVKAYAARYKTTRNNIFIGSIHDSHEFSFDQLGGVRIIQ